MTDSNKNQNYSAKFNIISAALRLGHEAFQKDSFTETAYHILNNTRMLVDYDRACIVDMREAKPKILAVSGQSEVNYVSDFCINMQKFLENFKNINDLKLINAQEIEKNDNNKKIIEDFKYFKKLNDNILIIPFFYPQKNIDTKECVFWVIEIFSQVEFSAKNTLSLLAQHYSEAIWFQLQKENKFFKKFFKTKKILTPVKILTFLLFFVFIILFFRISQTVSANFELIPKDESISYAPYSGIIDKVYFNNGANIKKGDTILKYDTKELTYKLVEASTSYDEITADLDWVRQDSFLDSTKLGKAKILALKQYKEKVEIEKIKWYLTKACIKAKIDGTLVLKESEKWVGKAVRAGDILFEIVSSDKLLAEVYLNESNSAVLSKHTKITLYLHTSPETPIHGKILSVLPKPMLTKNGQFCYILKMQIKHIKPNYFLGMRGIAKVSGQKVSIGYYLFKNIVLWWRKI